MLPDKLYLLVFEHEQRHDDKLSNECMSVLEEYTNATGCQELRLVSSRKK